MNTCSEDTHRSGRWHDRLTHSALAIARTSKRVTRAQTRIAPAFVGAALLVAGLAVTTHPAQAFERVGDKFVLVFAGRQPVPLLDPAQKYDWSTRMMQQALYDGLVKYEGDPATIKPWLAERWETSADSKVWTFHLAKNAKFHNGDPVDAAAVAYSFERILKINKGPAWMLSAFLKPEGIKVVDAHTVQFTLTEAFSPFLSFVPWWYIVNPAQVKANEVDGDMGQKWLTDHAAGSGPFKIKRWEQGVLYELEAVADYWKGWPQKQPLGGVIYKLSRESSGQKAALQRGEADIVEGLSPEDFDIVAKLPGIVVENHAGMTTFGIKFNTQKAPTDDIELRKAIAFAFDYDAFLKIYNGNAKLQTSPFPFASTDQVDVKEIPRQDLAKAKAHLAKSKHPNGSISIEYVYVQGLEEERQMGLVLIDNLQKLNIKVDMVPLTWPNMVARAAKKDSSPAMMAVFATPVATDPDAVAYQYHEDSWGKYYGSSFYDDKAVHKLIDEGRATADADKRKAIYAEIQQRIVADQPEIFGMLANRRWALRNHVKGFNFSPVRFTGEVDLYPLWIGK